MQIHVDPLGGWSGDMFVAGVLDAFPALWPAVRDAVGALRLGPAARCAVLPHNDGTLTGSRFAVEAERAASHRQDHSHGQDHAHAHDHSHGHHHPAGHHHHGPGDHGHDAAGAHGPHRAWAEIRRLIEAAPLPGRAGAHAVGIFALLAGAEARVHGIAEEDVRFHEVGAVDSIVDIVAAGVLIDGLGASRWTASPLPLGGGRVRTMHGWLPVPAPATALLLQGLPVLDDGVGGERVTPTGAAIARYLLMPGAGATDPAPRRLLSTGTGFGTRRLEGMSNCLRVLAFEALEQPARGAFGHRELAVVTFEVDDQSAEDLAHGLDHLRALPGVHDVVQSLAFGKKGRMATHVQLLVAPEHRDAAIAACFTETTTIGLRYHTVQGAALPRRFAEVAAGGRTLRVKAVTRPDGRETGKVEAGDVADEPTHAARAALRRAGEAAALEPGTE